MVFAVNYSSNQSEQGSTESTNPYTTTDQTATTPVTTSPTATTPSPTTPKNPTPTPTPTTPSYTLTQVSTHNNSSDCWSIVRTTVYNLTPWINKHPGGAGAILSMCGKDATASFEDQHGGQRRPENELAGYEIGIYKK